MKQAYVDGSEDRCNKGWRKRNEVARCNLPQMTGASTVHHVQPERRTARPPGAAATASSLPNMYKSTTDFA